MTALFGTTPEGAPVYQLRIAAGGTVAHVLTWGATVQQLRVPGMDHSLILGGLDMAAYLGPMRYFGAIVGPVANRIAKGQMVIDGQLYSLDRNEAGRTTLHGGVAGFDAQNWAVVQADAASCTLVLHHPAGRGGFPGNIRAQVCYRLDIHGALEVEVTGETDAPTPFSPAFHGYWSLDGTADLRNHRLQVFAPTYLPVDADQIPLGAPQLVTGSAFDYRTLAPIGDLLDHNFCLATGQGRAVAACRVETARLRLDVQTTEPGVQIYNGHHINTGTIKGIDGAPYGRSSGLAIEPQFWPDTPNHPSYPSNLLRPGQKARHWSRFEISRRADD